MTAQSAPAAKATAPAERQNRAESASQWFYAKNGREYGPFDAVGLRDAARSGQSSVTMRYWSSATSLELPSHACTTWAGSLRISSVTAILAGQPHDPRHETGLIIWNTQLPSLRVPMLPKHTTCPAFAQSITA